MMPSDRLLFLKLGGSLLTDKTGTETARADVLARVSREIAAVIQKRPHLQLVIGHGSGSFGHVAAAKYGTQRGVRTAEQWMGFCQVSAAALRLNRLVREALLEAGIPILSIQPAASTVCDSGKTIEMAVEPIFLALEAGLVPLLHGDVALDRTKGGTIVSTEQVLGFLVGKLKPGWFLLAGNTAGVLDHDGDVISHIQPLTLPHLGDALGGSEGTDVTGGMATKVRDMVTLVQRSDNLRIRIFSGVEPGLVSQVLLDPQHPQGTLISA